MFNNIKRFYVCRNPFTTIQNTVNRFFNILIYDTTSTDRVSIIRVRD